jgi:hypothetical protein
MNCIENIRQLLEKNDNKEIEEATNELFKELQKIKKKHGELQNNKMDEYDEDEEHMDNSDSMSID